MKRTTHNRSKKKLQTQDLLVVLWSGRAIPAFEAAKSLIALDATDAIPEVCRILKDGKTSDNRAAAAYVLGFLAGQAAINCLLKALRGSDSVKVRSHAAEALGHTGDERAVDGLIGALTDRAATVRYWAAFALGEIGSHAALVPLRKLAREDHGVATNGEKVSKEARRAIARLENRGS